MVCHHFHKSLVNISREDYLYLSVSDGSRDTTVTRLLASYPALRGIPFPFRIFTFPSRDLRWSNNSTSRSMHIDRAPYEASPIGQHLHDVGIQSPRCPWLMHVCPCTCMFGHTRVCGYTPHSLLTFVDLYLSWSQESEERPLEDQEPE